MEITWAHYIKIDQLPPPQSLPSKTLCEVACKDTSASKAEEGAGGESDVVAVFKLFYFMRLWLILVAKQPLKAGSERRG